MKPLPFANSLAVVSGIFWIICSIFIWVLPAFSLYLTKLGLMGLQGLTLTGFKLDFSTFLTGLIFTVVIVWIFGYIWGWFYQKFSKEK